MLVIFAVSLIALLGFAAMAIDVGYYLAERRNVQNATDSAAMATARLVLQNDTDDLVTQAESFLAANGYQDAAATVTWDDDEVRVEVEHEVERFFLGAVYDGDWSVSTVAVAQTAPEEVPFAIIALGEDQECNDPEGVRFSGNVTVNTSGGGIGTNACVGVDGAAGQGEVDGQIEAYGTIDDRISNFNPTGYMAERQGIIPDPYADFVAESQHPMDSTDCQNVDPEIERSGNGSNETATMSPGRYTSASNLNFKGDVTMQPGIYCLETELRLQNSNTSLDASSGVLMYLASSNGNFAPGNGSYEINTIDEDGARIAIWSDNCDDPLDLKGNGQMQVTGVIYAPCTALELGGTSGTDVLNGQVVAHDVWFHGNVEFNIDAGLERTADPLRVFLVE